MNGFQKQINCILNYYLFRYFLKYFNFVNILRSSISFFFLRIWCEYSQRSSNFWTFEFCCCLFIHRKFLQILLISFNILNFERSEECISKSFIYLNIIFYWTICSRSMVKRFDAWTFGEYSHNRRMFFIHEITIGTRLI